MVLLVLGLCVSYFLFGGRDTLEEKADACVSRKSESHVRVTQRVDCSESLIARGIARF